MKKKEFFALVSFFFFLFFPFSLAIPVVVVEEEDGGGGESIKCSAIRRSSVSALVRKPSCVTLGSGASGAPGGGATTSCRGCRGAMSIRKGGLPAWSVAMVTWTSYRPPTCTATALLIFRRKPPRK